LGSILNISRYFQISILNKYHFHRPVTLLVNVVLTLVLASMLTLPVAMASHDAESSSLTASTSQSSKSGESEQSKAESAAQQIEELINSDLQLKQRDRLRAYEAAGLTVLTGGMMLVGALAGGPVIAVAAGVSTLTIYMVLD